MKVTSGKFKGRSLHSPEGLNVRPTGAKVKEAIFGKIQFLIIDKKFLDLFAGSGSMGIEALSRGASQVVFNDKSAKSIKIIKKNLELIDEECRVLNLNHSKAIKALENELFDFIYADPPYDKVCLNEILDLCYLYDTISIGGIIIYEHNSKIPLNYDNKHYIIIDNKLYATTSITYIKRVD